MHIYLLKLGIDCCYLLRNDQGKMVMIDGGVPKRARTFLMTLERLSLNPGDIKLIVLTHGHWDHIGSAGTLKNITGAEIALHRAEQEWLEKSLKPLSPAVTCWGGLLTRVMVPFLDRIRIPSATVDCLLGDGERSLNDYGIPGRIISTPGHSRGSVSVLLETGEAFVGDLAMNALPLRLFPGLPIFADDLRAVKESWKKLLDLGAKVVYPAHGKPFPAHVMRRLLK